MGWLNISYPVVAKQDNSTSVMPNFSEVLPQKGGTTYLVFDLYDNQLSTHSLTSDADWLTVPEEAKQPAKGHHVVNSPSEKTPARKLARLLSNSLRVVRQP